MTAPVARAPAVTVPVARDLIALCKPRITAMVVATGIAGALAAHVRPTLSTAACALVGTTSIVAAANVLNMWIERDTDARMERTRDRPLASGRVAPNVGLGFGLALAAVALPLLLAANLRVAVLGVVAFLVYVVVYTPMKRVSAWALPVGAIAGAMPPAMGWAAATGAVDGGALYLFALLFAWQLPHFVAIALFRGDEYAGAGLAVGARLAHAKTSLVVSAALFVAVTLLAPHAIFGERRIATAICAAVGAAFLASCVRAAGARAGRSEARGVFAFTMAHLAIVLVALGIRG